MSGGGRSRTAAIMLFAGIVLTIGAALVVPIAQQWSKNGAAIKEARIKTLHAAERKAAVNKLTATKTAWDTFVTSPQSGLSVSITDDIAISEMIERIENAFLQANGTVTAVTGKRGDAKREGVRSLIMSAEGTIPRAALADFLGRLEGQTPFIIIDQFSAKTAEDNLSLSLRGTVFRVMEDAS